VPAPSWAESLDPERAGIRQCETLIESGWSFDRVEKFLAGATKSLARHKADAEPSRS
jgi:hypothetical protein